MKLELVFSSQFRKDLKKIRRRHLNMDELNKVIDLLANCKELPAKYDNHRLNGKYKGYMECHIEPNWLLIYKISGDKVYLHLQRTGTHSDLF